MNARSFLPLLFVAAQFAQSAETVEVVSRSVDRTLKIPGELLPYQTVDIHARVNGYIEKMLADRGSVVGKDQILAVLSAPEMAAQAAEAEAKVKAAGSGIAEAEARLASAQATYDRLKRASETTGAVAGLELVHAEKEVDAARSLVEARQGERRAAEAALAATRKLEAYLEVRAPFAGVVSDRLLHPGALVGPTTDPLLRVQQVSRLRLVVPVPEASTAGIAVGRRVTFTVPAYPAATFPAVVARLPHTVDPKTRTMAVELDAPNPSGKLAPGMYPEVSFPVRSAAVLLVPKTAVVTTTERTFVIRAAQGRAEWVTVRKGASSGDLVEVYGTLSPGDRILKRASDEVREGTPL